MKQWKYVKETQNLNRALLTGFDSLLTAIFTFYLRIGRISVGFKMHFAQSISLSGRWLGEVKISE